MSTIWTGKTVKLWHYVSAVNSTDETAATFTGTFERCEDFQSVTATILSAQNGTLSFDFSDDGVTALYTVSFAVVGATAFTRTYKVAGKYVRIRFAGAGSGEILLQTILGNQAPDTLEAQILSALQSIGGLKTSVTLARNVYSVTPVTTSAYTQLVASLADDVTQLYIFDSSGRTLYLAVGAAASEVDKAYIVPGGNGILNLSIPAGSRVSLKAVDGTANVGEISVTFLK